MHKSYKCAKFRKKIDIKMLLKHNKRKHLEVQTIIIKKYKNFILYISMCKLVSIQK